MVVPRVGDNVDTNKQENLLPVGEWFSSFHMSCSLLYHEQKTMLIPTSMVICFMFVSDFQFFFFLVFFHRNVQEHSRILCSLALLV